MLLGTRKTLYDHIIEALLVKSGDASYVIAYLKNNKNEPTIQGVYKAFREMIAENIIVKRGKIYEIHNGWREKLSDLLIKRNSFTLVEGERIVYKFKKIQHTDLFWKHIWVDIAYEYTKNPVFEYIFLSNIFMSYLRLSNLIFSSY